MIWVLTISDFLKWVDEVFARSVPASCEFEIPWLSDLFQTAKEWWGVCLVQGVFDLIIVYYVLSFFRHLTINNLVKLIRNSLSLFMWRRRERG